MRYPYTRTGTCDNCAFCSRTTYECALKIRTFNQLPPKNCESFAMSVREYGNYLLLFSCYNYTIEMYMRK